MGVQLLGKITTTYKFSGLADFQYVPELPTEELKEPKGITKWKGYNTNYSLFFFFFFVFAIRSVR